MRRTLATLATLALSGIAAFTIATPAGAVGSVNVTPSTNLTDGTLVTVSWTGLQPNGTPSIVQCKANPATGASGADCEFQTLQVSADGSNAAGAGTDTFIVHDTNGLAAINPRTEVKCDSATAGSILVVDNANDPSSGSSKTITCTGSSTVTPPPSVLLSCTGISQVATVNPTLGSVSAKYAKIAGKDSLGTSTEFGTGAPIPADNTTCAVGSGIRTNNAGTDSTKPNPYDDQTVGQSSLTTAGATAKTVLVLDGSATCQTIAQATVNNSYPQAYPLQGKVTTTFDQLNSLAKPIVLQEFVRLDRDASDPDSSHYKVHGIVIKGPGVGADVSATVRLWPTSDVKKNLNPADCTDPDVTATGNHASIGQVAITLADGSDQDTTVDPWTVSLPA
jgi:hypothetical protein